MQLFTKQQYAELTANGSAFRLNPAYDPRPVARLTTTNGTSTWLVVAINDDYDLPTFLALTDHGKDCASIETVWLQELQDLASDGVYVVPDPAWKPQGPISAYIKACGGTRLVDHLPVPGLNDDYVAEWVGLHYRRVFDTEPDDRKAEWRERYAAVLAGEERPTPPRPVEQLNAVAPTQGPWEAYSTNRAEQYIDQVNPDADERKPILRIHHDDNIPDSEARANVRLIVAAHDLLAACEDDDLDKAHDRLSDLLEDDDAGNDDIRDAAIDLCACLCDHFHKRRLAIAKAKGGAA